ncbi:MAG: Protein translocase subunit SecY [Chlamydiia bacterium]|nr:Protein translocase subunit SecY [Chlamydiia bacterium]
MFEKLSKILSNKELKGKIAFTIFMLILCRVGAYVPVPGINGEEAVKLLKHASGGGQNFLQLADMFSGGAFAQMTVLALGVVPYITSSIILQLLVALIPSLQREVKENSEVGRKKVNKYTKFLTVGLALFQSYIFATFVLSLNASSPGIIVSEMLKPQMMGTPWLYYMMFMVTMTTGTVLLMWVGDLISEKGIGNGVSLIITIGILSSFPSTIGAIISKLNLDSPEPGQMTFTSFAVLIGLFVMIIAGTIMVIQGVRKIPVQYARRSAGDAEGANKAHIPLKINFAGVIPVIFTSSVLMFPAMIGQFMGRDSFLSQISSYISMGSWTYTIIFVLLILFFTYFWTATQFHPEQIASDLKKNGGFIPGVKQGKPTEEYIEHAMNKITFLGGIFLALIAVMPTLVAKLLGIDATISHFFGGTSLLILIGVILDTTKQIDSHMIMKRYDGFMQRRRGKLGW